MKLIRIPLIVKVIAYHLLFMVMHYLYDMFPNSITHLFGATNESVFQHMKVMFHAYILLAGIEYALTRNSIVSLKRHFYARIHGAVVMPLLMLVFFFAGPAIFGKIESIPLEIVFANIALLAISTTTFLLENHFEQLEPSRGLKIVLITMFLLAAMEFVIFNYRLPWMDVFANPPGW